MCGSSRRGPITGENRGWYGKRATEVAPDLRKSSPDWTRTNNLPVNSRLLCQLSYRGLLGTAPRSRELSWRPEPQYRSKQPPRSEGAQRVPRQPEQGEGPHTDAP
jgi:hypothetical protein